MVFWESIEASDFLISINNFNFLSGEVRQGQNRDTVGDMEGKKFCLCLIFYPIGVSA